MVIFTYWKPSPLEDGVNLLSVGVKPLVQNGGGVGGTAGKRFRLKIRKNFLTIELSTVEQTASEDERLFLQGRSYGHRSGISEKWPWVGLGQQFPTLVGQMFFNTNILKASPPSCAGLEFWKMQPKNIWGTKVGNHCPRGIQYCLKTIIQQCPIPEHTATALGFQCD